MDTYTGRIAIDRGAAEVFAFLADIRTMPHYLPTVRKVGPLGPDRVAVEGESDGHAYHDEGWLTAEAETGRLRWGTNGTKDYEGELSVHGTGGRAEVEVRLTLSPDRPMARRMQQQHGSLAHGMRMALDRTLGAIKAACEGGAGAAAEKDTTRSADDLRDSRPFGHSATLNPDI
ncbi:MAG: SRPBCC family protein [Acetobacteraceae bacterium]|nr:SRPBCC family protein [Acetobacteraceae bacterium]